MSRSLPAALAAHLLGAHVIPAILASIGTAAGTVRVWSGTGQLVWGSLVFVGVGDLGMVEAIRESADIEAVGLAFKLSGVESSMIGTVLGSLRQGFPAQLYVGGLDSAGVLVSDPYLVWEGITDTGEISDDGTTATIVVAAENRLIDLERPRFRRYTDQDQRNDWPSDRGFEYVAGLQDREIPWGR